MKPPWKLTAPPLRRVWRCIQHVLREDPRLLWQCHLLWRAPWLHIWESNVEEGGCGREAKRESGTTTVIGVFINHPFAWTDAMVLARTKPPQSGTFFIASAIIVHRFQERNHRGEGQAGRASPPHRKRRQLGFGGWGWDCVRKSICVLSFFLTDLGL